MADADTQTSGNTPRDQYEGAGMLLTHKGAVLFGIRIKTEKDRAKDPTEELEYMGGKPEAEDGGDPSTTAHAELIEEVGGNPLAANWRSRARILHIWQPFSKKWIWCHLLELTDHEFARLRACDEALTGWPADERRSFTAETGRSAPVRKSLARIVQMPGQQLVDVATAFAQFDTTNPNRMAAAKAFAKQHPCSASPVCGGPATDHTSRPIRAFNLVIFHEHAHTIAQHLGLSHRTQ